MNKSKELLLIMSISAIFTTPIWTARPDRSALVATQDKERRELKTKQEAILESLKEHQLGEVNALAIKLKQEYEELSTSCEQKLAEVTQERGQRLRALEEDAQQRRMEDEFEKGAVRGAQQQQLQHRQSLIWQEFRTKYKGCLEDELREKANLVALHQGQIATLCAKHASQLESFVKEQAELCTTFTEQQKAALDRFFAEESDAEESHTAHDSELTNLNNQATGLANEFSVLQTVQTQQQQALDAFTTGRQQELDNAASDATDDNLHATPPNKNNFSGYERSLALLRATFYQPKQHWYNHSLTLLGTTPITIKAFNRLATYRNDPRLRYLGKALAVTQGVAAIIGIKREYLNACIQIRNMRLHKEKN